MKILGGGAALFATCTVGAQSLVDVDRQVFVESSQQREGRVQRSLEPANMLEQGDRVVLMLAWRSAHDAPFTISTRVSPALAFRRSGRETPQVSVDGGRTWGRLARLRVGSRRAVAADVTNIRWDVHDPRAAQGRGVFTYSAVVR